MVFPYTNNALALARTQSSTGRDIRLRSRCVGSTPAISPNFLDLPVEVRRIIGTYLQPSDVLAMMQTSSESRNAHIYDYLLSTRVLYVHKSMTTMRLIEVASPFVFSSIHALPPFKTPSWTLQCDLFHLANNAVAISTLLATQQDLDTLDLCYRDTEEHLLGLDVFHDTLRLTQVHLRCLSIKISRTTMFGGSEPRPLTSALTTSCSEGPVKASLPSPKVVAAFTADFLPETESLDVHIACLKIPSLARLFEQLFTSPNFQMLSINGLSTQADADLVDIFLPYSPYLKSLEIYAKPGGYIRGSGYLFLTNNLFLKVPCLERFVYLDSGLHRRLEARPSISFPPLKILVFTPTFSNISMDCSNLSVIRIDSLCSWTHRSYLSCHDMARALACVGTLSKTLINSNDLRMVIRLPFELNAHCSAMEATNSKCSCLRGIKAIQTGVAAPGVSKLTIEHAGSCIPQVHACIIQILRLYFGVKTLSIQIRGSLSCEATDGSGISDLTRQMPLSVTELKHGTAIYNRSKIGGWVAIEKLDSCEPHGSREVPTDALRGSVTLAGGFEQTARLTRTRLEGNFDLNGHIFRVQSVKGF
ncbi:hypothetical protein DFP72DRAFT_855715 [Ephemerocybe angulata]|uniref:F-box domain-containing protein n=1 Tax=Ephemerocybe angulata TaxID=980116 RepID=A0A8H6LYT2_9AGAR|nr:hypothetical protein DFP72DRAFT_855715 [Tulosesus angulatus]